MEANTVILSLPEYNALRDFKTNLEKGETYRVLDYSQQVYADGYNYSTVLFISTEDAVKEVKAANLSLAKRLTDLQMENYDLKRGILEERKPKEIPIDQIKRMSWREFRIWRKK